MYFFYILLIVLILSGGFDFRPIIHYRDLDAPKEPEENFI